MRATAGRLAKSTLVVLSLGLLLTGCGRIGNVLNTNDGPRESAAERNVREDLESTSAQNARQSTFFDLFTNADDPNTTIEVNKYLWNASLDVLNFLPIQSADPFSGVIVTGRFGIRYSARSRSVIVYLPPRDSTTPTRR